MVLATWVAPWLGEILHEERVSPDRHQRGCSEYRLQGCLHSSVLCVPPKGDLAVLYRSLKGKHREQKSVFNLMPHSNCTCMFFLPASLHYSVLSPEEKLEVSVRCHTHAWLALHRGCAVPYGAGDRTLLRERHRSRQLSTAHVSAAQDASGVSG